MKILSRLNISLSILGSIVLLCAGPGEAYSDDGGIEFFSLSLKGYEKIKVVEVIRTDTILLENDKKVKLIGLKGLEPPKEKRQVGAEGQLVRKKNTGPLFSQEEAAFDFVVKLLKDKWVRLEFDAKKQDDDFTLSAYVFILPDNILANEEILKAGYADLQLRPPNMKYARKLRDAYREARKEKRGIQGEY